MARFLDLLANTKQTCLRKSDPALPRREPRAAALLGMLSSRRVVWIKTGIMAAPVESAGGGCVCEMQPAHKKLQLLTFKWLVINR